MVKNLGCVAASLLAAGMALSMDVARAADAPAHPHAQGTTPPAATPAAAVKRFALHSNIVDGKMVFIDERGQVNPVLRAAVGDTIEVVLVSGEGAEHDFVSPELNVASAKVSAATPPATVRFKLTQPGRFAYYCSIPGHRQIGMEGVFEVTGEALAQAPADANRAALALYAPAATQLRAADPAAVSVAGNPAAVPEAVGTRGPRLQKIRMETVELAGKLDDGTTFTSWTFDRTVPGPMLRAWPRCCPLSS